jgi:hypothetical protein
LLSNFGRLSEISVARLGLSLKFRHVFARALVGWYLIIPSSTLPPGIAHKEPFRKWQIVRGFDSADDCEDFRSAFFEHSRQKHGLNVLEPAYRDYMFAECIATDDPRLRGD